jgi:hypothetical protein
MASLDTFLNDHVKNIIFVRSALMARIGDVTGPLGVVEAVPEPTSSLHSGADELVIIKTRYNALAQQFGVLVIVVSAYLAYAGTICHS